MGRWGSTVSDFPILPRWTPERDRSRQTGIPAAAQWDAGRVQRLQRVHELLQPVLPRPEPVLELPGGLPGPGQWGMAGVETGRHPARRPGGVHLHCPEHALPGDGQLEHAATRIL